MYFVTIITCSCFVMLFIRYFVTLTSCVSLGCRWLPLDLFYIATSSRQMLLFNYVNYVFVVIFTYLYCYICSVLCFMYHCVLCTFCVQMCTVLLSPRVNPTAVNEIYHII